MSTLASTNDGETQYLVSQFNYTTAQVEESRFCGERPNSLYFAASRPLTEVSPLILTVIDGELRVVRDEPPPGAHLPNPASGLFKLADAPELTEAFA